MKYFTSLKTNKDAQLFAEKKANIKKYRANYIQEKEILDNYPLEIFAEVSNSCNIRCIMCCETGNKWKNITNPYLPVSLVEKVYGYLDKAIMFHAFGFGEPLCNKNFMKIIQLIKHKKLFLDFFTNAVLLETAKSKKIITKGVNCIYVSLNGATKETYEKIHRGAKFEKTIENLTQLKELKRELKQKIPEMKINMIAMNSNFEEFPAIVKLAKELGITAIEIKPLLTYDHMPDLKKEFRSYDPERDDSIIDETMKVAYQSGILVNFEIYKQTNPNIAQSNNPEQPVEIQKTQKKEDVLCFQPWKTFYIRSDGFIRPCCFYNHGDFEKEKTWLGNLNTQTMEEIWNGPEYQSIRNDLKNGRIPKGCEYCFKYNLRPRIDDSEAIMNIINNNSQNTFKAALKLKLKLFLLRYVNNKCLKTIKGHYNNVRQHF